MLRKNTKFTIFFKVLMLSNNKRYPPNIESAARAYERINGPLLSAPENVEKTRINHYTWVRDVIVHVILSGKDAPDPIEAGALAYEKHLGPVRGFPHTLRDKEAKIKSFDREVLIPAVLFAAKHPISENVH